MNLKRQIAAVGGALALVAGGASVALVGGMSSSSAAEVPSSAFGLQSTGLIPIDAMPSVTSTDGKLVKDSVIGLPDNPVITGGVINAQAENNNAEADVSNVNVGDGLLSQLTGALSDLTTQLQPVCDGLSQVPVSQLQGAVDQVTGTIDTQLLGALLPPLSSGAGIDLSAITAIDLSQLLPEDLGALCDALNGLAGVAHVGAVTAECHGTTGSYSGSTSVADLKVLGLPLNVNTSAANTHITVPQVADITLNKQVTNADGTFTVTGLEINLFGGQDVISIASATCGHVTNRVVPTPTTDAPSPTPTHTRAPVTG